MNKKKVPLRTYKCSNCQSQSALPSFGDMFYGCLVLRNSTLDQFSYLGIADKAFKEILEFSSNKLKVSGLQITSVDFNKFAVNYFLDKTGDPPVSYGEEVICPKCHSGKLTEITAPIETTEIEVASFSAFDRLKPEKRNQTLENLWEEWNEKNPEAIKNAIEERKKFLKIREQHLKRGMEEA